MHTNKSLSTDICYVQSNYLRTLFMMFVIHGSTTLFFIIFNSNLNTLKLGIVGWTKQVI